MTLKNNLKQLPYLYPIINVDTCQDPPGLLAAMIATGLDLFQIRCTTLSDRDFLTQALRLVEQARSLSSSARMVINNRIDVCQLTAADGVHLGQNDLDPRLARDILGPKAIIGFSTHSVEQVAAARAAPVTYLGFGPIYSSLTKRETEEVTGLAGLRQAVRHTNIPLVAIGGITSDNAQEIYACGAQSIAVIRDLEQSSTVALTVLRYQTKYEQSCHRQAHYREAVS